MNLERLNHLCGILKAVPEEQFDMSRWSFRQRPLHVNQGASCGFSGCAGGWAALDPEFIKAGLAFSSSSEPVFEGRIGFDALEKFFDLTPETTNQIFYPFQYPSGRLTKPSEVVERIIAIVMGESVNR